MKRPKTVSNLVEKYKRKFPTLEKRVLRRLIRIENPEVFTNRDGTEKSNEIRKLSRYLRRVYENETPLEESTKSKVDQTALFRTFKWSPQKIALFKELEKNYDLNQEEKKQRILDFANGNKKLADLLSFVDSLPPTQYYKVKLKCEYCGQESEGEVEGPIEAPTKMCPKCYRVNGASNFTITEIKKPKQRK